VKGLLVAAVAAALTLAAPASAATKPRYVLALGDSFSAGVQPGPGQRKSYSYFKESYTNRTSTRRPTGRS
jgi:hypothetical protein